MPKNPRNYKEEYANYQGSEEQKKNRAARNKARREAVRDGRIEPGSSKEVDHKKPLSKGGGSGKSNTRVTTQKANRQKYNKG
jgi:hypothetical protein